MVREFRDGGFSRFEMLVHGGESRSLIAGADRLDDADMPLIAPLSCAMVEKDGDIVFLPGTRIRAVYGVETARETYHCSYGFHPRYAPLFASSEMIFSAVNARNDPHAVELPPHPFFVATAFQPERSAFRGAVHPLIAEFVRAAQSGADQPPG